MVQETAGHSIARRCHAAPCEHVALDSAEVQTFCFTYCCCFPQDCDDSKWPELLVDWNIQNLPSLRRLLRFIDDVEKVNVVREVIEAFEHRVLKHESELQKGTDV